MAQKRIAFYGKGGIGKTSLAANTAAELARSGKRVLLIGCDLKADSCLTLTGRRIPTVLQQSALLDRPLTREDVLFFGAEGVGCMESGGPAAGVGCAGMGFGIMMNEVERLGILKDNWDIILYDVLGDVVCSGFSVPMRSQYADQIFLVTTSSYMSLYAANNILSSALHLSGQKNPIGGVIQNRWMGDGAPVDRFCEKTGVPCVARISEDDLWGEAECAGRCVGEYPNSRPAEEISQLAEKILFCGSAFVPMPLSVEEMDAFRWECRKKEGKRYL